uniref:GTP cyclohydrolase II n=1 Tax=Cyanophora paradoxa TaxID=2762 RepID=A0A126X3A2_CYAPA|nr:putative LOV domain-containing protein [Cyanophora paradoxa]
MVHLCELDAPASEFVEGQREQGVVITNAQELIVYCSDEFSRITGYDRSEIIGKNCRFLQGAETDPHAVEEIRRSRKERKPCRVALLNYRRDGTQFWNLLTITPILDKTTSQITNFAGSLFMVGLVPSPHTDRHFIERRRITDGAIISLSELDLEDDLDSSSASSSMSSSSDDLLGKPSLSRRKAQPIRTNFVAETRLPTHKGFYRVRAYRDSENTGYEPLAIIYGDVSGRDKIAVRVHDQCMTSEVLGSLKCDCKEQLDYAMEYIRDNGPGVVIYLQQEGRGIGLANKIAAYAMQEKGYDTVDANRVLGLPDDARDYRCVVDILNDLDVDSIVLITNNPRKVDQLTNLGVEVVGRIPVILPCTQYNVNYLVAKAARMGHVVDRQLEVKKVELR